MSDSGWIKINRAITRHWIWSNSEYLQWWLDLLFLAQWEDKKVMHDTHLFTLKRGQMIASISFLSHRWKRSRKVIIRYLNMLEQEQMIMRTTRDRQTAILTICNYEYYQKVGDTIGDTIGDTNKRNKEYKEEVFKEEIYKEESSGKGKESDSSKASEEIFRYFNEMMAHKAIPPIARMIEKRKGMISARMREGYNLEAILSMIKRASESDFLNGLNSRNWIANFDWLFLPNNFPKVHEGNYDNRTKDNERSNSRGESQAQAADRNNRFTSPEVPKDYSERF